MEDERTLPVGNPVTGLDGRLTARPGSSRLRRAAVLYPGSDLNRHWTVFETVASANWATGACG